MFKTLSSKLATQLDQELMGSGGFSIDQLMELAGLSVAQAIYKQYPPETHKKVLVLVGPGNNGGDGLVAARHLKLWNYEPQLYYPKKPNNPLYQRLMVQLKDLDVGEVTDFKDTIGDYGVIVDAIFGFSFKPPIRSPFDEVIEVLSQRKSTPIVSIDIPSGWDVDHGPLQRDIGCSMLVLLTAPKPCANMLKPGTPHYLGGRFVNSTVAAKYGITELVGKYKGDDMVVKL